MSKKKNDEKIRLEVESDGTMTASGKAFCLEELITNAGIDLEIWECYDFTVESGAWDVTMNMKGKNDKPDEAITKTNHRFSVKAKFKRKINIIYINEFRKNLIAEISKNVPKSRIKPVITDGNNMLEIDVFDFHFGKLGWIQETNTGNYDAKIAKRIWEKSIITLLARAVKSQKISKIVFPVGNDFFNTDLSLPAPTTTRGTPQQEDLRWQKTFIDCIKLVRYAIQLMLEVAPVDIIIVPGNHDFTRAFYLGAALEGIYENDKYVDVNNQAIPYKFTEWGKNLIGYAHGNSKDISIDRLRQLMQIDEAKAWARTAFHEWHLGDIHHKKIIKTPGGTINMIDLEKKFHKGQLTEEDFQGIVIRYMRSITGDDGWHIGKGYKGSIKGAEGYIFNKKEGPIHILNFNPEQKLYR